MVARIRFFQCADLRIFGIKFLIAVGVLIQIEHRAGEDGSYCETFTSPKSGVIEVKGLRVGIYTVTEISNRASRDYIIPDAATVEGRKPLPRASNPQRESTAMPAAFVLAVFLPCFPFLK